MTIYFDGNFPPSIARALNELQSARPHEGVEEVCRTTDCFGMGAKDEAWLPALGKEGRYVVITEDVKMHHRLQLVELIRGMNIVMVFIKPPRKKPYLFWEKVSIIFKHLAEIKQWGMQAGPLAYEIGESVKKLWPREK